MGLQQVTYTLDAAPDWAALETALRASMGVRVSVRVMGDVASVQAGGIGGGAHLRCAGGQLEWEAPLGANPYFLTHLHDAVLSLGARPIFAHAPADPGRGVPWRALPLRRRLVHGLVGQVARGVVGFVLMPVVLFGLVVANLGVLARRVWRQWRTPAG
jgi:hypothetical protein